MRILFQGDSITDAGRDRNDMHNLGEGYPKYAAELLKNRCCDPELINLGIGGNKAEDLAARWEADCISLNPDIVSILIGINDTWHRAENQNWMPNDYFEACYRSILVQTKERTQAKIIIMEQFLLPVPDKAFFRVDLDPKIQITRRLAREFADFFIPLDGLFAAACIGREAADWAGDGVHPTPAGAAFIARHYSEAVCTLMGC